MQVAWSLKTTLMMPQELSRLRNQGVGFLNSAGCAIKAVASSQKEYGISTNITKQLLSLNFSIQLF
jgi:hypothetical protein